MKIGVLIFGRSIQGGGGAERRFIRVINRFNETGYKDVRLVINRTLLDDLLSQGILKNSENVDVINDKFILNYLYLNVYLAKKVFFEKKYDLIHLVLVQKSLLPFYLSLALIKNKKFKVVSTVADYRMAYGNGLNYIEGFVYDIYKMASDHIDALYPRAKLSGKLFSITPTPFTDYENFVPKRKENIILFAGRFYNFKNPLLFVDSLLQILDSNHSGILNSWKIYICGSGPLESVIRKRILQSGFLERFVIGKCSDLSDLMGRSKIFVSLQSLENYPSQSLIEAIVTNNNIIVSDVGDTRLMFESNVAHFVSLDVTELSQRITDIIQNGGFSNEELESASQKFKQANNVDSFKTYLEGIWKIS